MRQHVLPQLRKAEALGGCFRRQRTRRPPVAARSGAGQRLCDPTFAVLGERQRFECEENARETMYDGKRPPQCLEVNLCRTT